MNISVVSVKCGNGLSARAHAFDFIAIRVIAAAPSQPLMILFCDDEVDDDHERARQMASCIIVLAIIQ